jgi:hypothetical protein
VPEHWAKVEYHAPNPKVGFSAHQIQDVLQRHSPLCLVRAVVGWSGQIKSLVIITPEDDPLAGKSFDSETEI